MRKKLVLTAGFLLLALGFLALPRFAPLDTKDPDRYYHLALSKMMVSSGQLFLRSLPQVEDLGWADNFVDKEFLFHQLTAAAYLLGGEAGVDLVPRLCAILGILAFLWFAGLRLPPVAAVFVTFMVFAAPYSLVRLNMVRPHTLAVLCFILMNIALLSRRPLATAICAALFTLSYHAFYVPIACLLLAGAASFLAGNKAAEWRRLSAFGIFGVIVGVLVNPYFYGNVEIAMLVARIPGLIKSGITDLNFGRELYPVRSDGFVEVFHLPIALLMAGFFLAGREWKKESAELREQLVPLCYLLGISAFFMYLTTQSPRGGEYLAPSVGLLAVYLFKALPVKAARFAVVIPLIFGLSQVYVFYRRVHLEAKIDLATPTGNSLAAIAAIPADASGAKVAGASGAKVYNCEWGRGAYILYARPDLRFIDLLDPSLVYFKHPGAFRARADLRKGNLANAHGMIRDAAKADFVLCAEPTVVGQLSSDPGFQKIYPPNPSADPSGLSVFRVRKDNAPEFATAFLVSKAGAYLPNEIPKLSGSEPGALVEGVHAYLDLAQLLSPKLENASAPGLLRCAVIRLTPEETRRRAGATLLIAGGGQGMEIWRNGKPLFQSLPAFTHNRATQVTVPLSPPLQASDRLDALVCSGTNVPFWGYSLSLWTEQELKKTCAWKSEFSKAPVPGKDTPFQGLQRANCLAPYAAKSQP